MITYINEQGCFTDHRIDAGFLRWFRDPIRVPWIKNWVPRITENRVPRIREIGSLQVHIAYLTFSFKNLHKCDVFWCWKRQQSDVDGNDLSGNTDFNSQEGNVFVNVHIRVAESQWVGGFWVKSESVFLFDSGSLIESFLHLTS